MDSNIIKLEAQKERLNRFRSLFVPLLLLFIATFGGFIFRLVGDDKPNVVEMIPLMFGSLFLSFALVFIYSDWAAILRKLDNIKEE